jgi:histidyl-tRNA synthetase
MTPSLARLVAARAGSLRRPLKWFSIGEQYRYEKPQKGRLRSFYQFNADILGEPGPAADAEAIALLVESLKSCGLKEGEFEVRISDRKLWFLFLAWLKIDDSKIPEVLAKVDKWERSSKDEIVKALFPYFGDLTLTAYDEISGFIQGRFFAEVFGEITLTTSSTETVIRTPNEEIKDKLKKRRLETDELFERLDQLGAKGFYRYDLRIVRGLAYYTGFVFEAFQTVGTARALAGGGRYDNLIQKLGGPDLPAVGFAIGDVTVTDLLTELKRPLGAIASPDLYFVLGEGPAIRSSALSLIGQLRAAGFSVDYPLKETGFGKQFKAADQVGARLTLILGADEVAQGQVKIKDMRSGEEIALPNDASLPARLREKIAP